MTSKLTPKNTLGNLAARKRPQLKISSGILLLAGSLMLAQAILQTALAQQSPLAASWEGIPSDPNFLLEPPDPHGAAGPKGILQVVNTRIAYWDKTGKPTWGPMALETFFPWAANSFLSCPSTQFAY